MIQRVGHSGRFYFHFKNRACFFAGVLALQVVVIAPERAICFIDKESNLDICRQVNICHIAKRRQSLFTIFPGIPARNRNIDIVENQNRAGVVGILDTHAKSNFSGEEWGGVSGLQTGRARGHQANAVNIELVLNANIIKLNGEKHLESIETDNGHTINVDGLFVSIGRIPNAAGLVDGLNLVDDYIDSGEDCTTNIPGIFVAGDVRTKELRQFVTATSDGAIAATAAINFLHK